MNSLQGYLLVASPHLPDPNFFRSVVLMIKHSEQGAFGLVLNRPSNHTLAEIWPQVSGEPCSRDDPIHVGGPVPGPLLAVHSLEEAAEEEVVPDVFFAAQNEHLRAIMNQHEQPYRMFTGYAGWGDGQLEAEIEVGGWLAIEATYERVFSPPDRVWKRLVGEIGEDIFRATLGIDEGPEDPALN